jgi:hypothetical protein
MGVYVVPFDLVDVLGLVVVIVGFVTYNFYADNVEHADSGASAAKRVALDWRLGAQPLPDLVCTDIMGESLMPESQVFTDDDDGDIEYATAAAP